MACPGQLNPEYQQKGIPRQNIETMPSTAFARALKTFAGFRAQNFFRFAPLFWLAEKIFADIVRKGRKMAILAALLQKSFPEFSV